MSYYYLKTNYKSLENIKRHTDWDHGNSVQRKQNKHIAMFNSRLPLTGYKVTSNLA